MALTAAPARRTLRARVARGRARLRRFAREVWGADRARLAFWPALWNRLLRIAIWAARGVSRHRLSVQSAALTYYTVFSIVPVLVVTLWVLKALDAIPGITNRLPNPTATAAAAEPLAGNAVLGAAARGILTAVEKHGLPSGIVGLGALLYGVLRMFRYAERSLDNIAGASARRGNYWRLLGYLGMVILPPVALAIWALVTWAAHGLEGGAVDRLLGAVPALKLIAAVALGLGAPWLALTLFYSAAARARIPFGSSAVGGAVAAVALAAVLWAFAVFQIGVAKAGALESGLAAVPVFMLWTFSSWFVVLVGAEIAVGHDVDRVCVHGAGAFRLDAAGEQAAGVAIVARATRAALAGGGAPAVVSTSALARELRLLPEIVRPLCVRLAKRGLLAPAGLGSYRLACDPDRTSARDVVDALGRDPSLDRARAELLDGVDARAVSLRAMCCESPPAASPSPDPR